jgi:hypothetical protein
MKQNGQVKEEKTGIYLIGSLRNENVPILAKELREALGVEVFDDWFSPGPKADDFWRDYEHVRGSTYKQALHNYAGTHVFEFDHFHIERLPIGILYMPAGKSGHMELGYMIGKGKRTYILFDKEPERWDVMYQFTFLNGGDVFFDKKELIAELKKVVAEQKKNATKKEASTAGSLLE